jgi:hypothetical protein
VSFDYDATGISADSNGCIPEGEYILEIVSARPGKTNNGDPKVTVDYVVAEGAFKGKKVKFHTVTFFRDKTVKAAGIAIHYLKTIGQPFEGPFKVEPENWKGKMLKAKVVQEPYGDYVNAKVKFVDPVDGEAKAPAAQQEGLLEDAPF